MTPGETDSPPLHLHPRITHVLFFLCQCLYDFTPMAYDWRIQQLRPNRKCILHPCSCKQKGCCCIMTVLLFKYELTSSVETRCARVEGHRAGCLTCSWPAACSPPTWQAMISSRPARTAVPSERPRLSKSAEFNPKHSGGPERALGRQHPHRDSLHSH